MITNLPPNILAVSRADARCANWAEEDESAPDPKPDAPDGWAWWWLGEGEHARYSLVQLQCGPEGIYNQLDFDHNSIVVWTYQHYNPKALHRLNIPRG